MTIRPETPADCAAIRSVNQSAFGRPDEADLVDRLRAGDVVLLSLVADLDGVVAGHILFTRMFVGAVAAVALAPVAVAPPRQGRGIGAALVRAGLDRLRRSGERIVLVVGHPGWYPRFGFSSSAARAIDSPFPPDAFMALALAPGALDGVRGPVRYPAPFGL